MSEETNALPTGYTLHRYQIEGVLGAGGFGITYKAIHEALENEVAIKEYFPAEWAYRDHNGAIVRANAQGQIPARSTEPPCYEWGLQRFLDEAKILVQINHPGVVRVRDYFTANGTAYIVMEYEKGESLSVSLHRSGILQEPELYRILNDVIPALEAVHTQGYLHRDIKPSNLYVRASNRQIILIDFGAARQALGRRTRSVTSVVTPGYSPIEQYVTVGEDYGPWTDIYAIGAVLYRCITGTPPVEAPGRVLKDPVQPASEIGAGLYSLPLLRLVDRAIAVRPEERFQTVAAMRDALRESEPSILRPTEPSQLPPLDPGLLEQVSRPSRSLFSIGIGPSELSEIRSKATAHDLGGLSLVPSNPQPNPAARSGDPASLQDNPPVSTDGPSAQIQFEDADHALPLLENIWDRIAEEPPPPTGQPGSPMTGSASPALPAAAAPPSAPSTPLSMPTSPSTSTLLNRPPQSALEHLRKAGSTRMGAEFSTPVTTTSTATAASLPVSMSLQPDFTSQPVIVKAKPVNWSRVLLTVFAVCGLAGISLLGYQYYQSMQEQSRREAAVQLQRQQEAEALVAQETASQQREEATRHLAQARQAMQANNWALASSQLDRATALSPDHPDLPALRTELAQARRTLGATRTRNDNAVAMTVHWIEGGCFTLGSPPEERDRGRDEAARQVCVKGFWMSDTEVSNSQFRRFKPAHNSGAFQGRSLNDDGQPAVNVNWDEARSFAEWLSWESGIGKRFRLPTEAEWEYAARAGSKTRYFWGDTLDPRYANFSDRNDPTGSSIGSLNDGQAVTAPVGSYQPNAFGLRDMAGNVWEWTCSDYTANYGGEEQRCSTTRPNQGLRTVRGGSWNSGAADLRPARRLGRKPDFRDGMTGLRVIMENPDSPKP